MGNPTIQELCRRAECDDKVYYRALKKPGFRSHLIGLGLDKWLVGFPKLADKMMEQAEHGQYNQQKYIADQVLGNQESSQNIQVNILNYKE